jgi:hypothetical protein
MNDDTEKARGDLLNAQRRYDRNPSDWNLRILVAAERNLVKAREEELSEDVGTAEFPVKCIHCGTTVTKNGPCPGPCGYSY